MDDSSAMVPHDPISVTPAPSYLPTQAEVVVLTTLAQKLATSGLVARGLSPEGAFLIMLQGRELGIGPVQSLRAIHIIEGKVCLSADVMGALIYRTCGDDALRVAERSAERCTILYKRPGWSEYASMTWTLDMARTAGLTGKANWKAYPDAMLFARCMSAVAHTSFQDVILGLYTPEEQIDMNEQAWLARPDQWEWYYKRLAKIEIDAPTATQIALDIAKVEVQQDVPKDVLLRIVTAMDSGLVKHAGVWIIETPPANMEPDPFPDPPEATSAGDAVEVIDVEFGTVPVR